MVLNGNLAALLTDAADAEAGGALAGRPAALGRALGAGEADAGAAVVRRVARAVGELHHVEQAQNCKERRIRRGFSISNVLHFRANIHSDLFDPAMYAVHTCSMHLAFILRMFLRAKRVSPAQISYKC